MRVSPIAYFLAIANTSLGQIARDMQSFGLRYGFVSTYNETIFLKIMERGGGDFCLHFSPIIKHSTQARRNKRSERLERHSLRLCLLYILSLVSVQDEKVWKIDKTLINPVEWTSGKNAAPGDDEGEEATPQKNVSIRTIYPARVVRESTQISSAASYRKASSAEEKAHRERRERGANTDVDSLQTELKSLSIRKRKVYTDTSDEEDRRPAPAE